MSQLLSERDRNQAQEVWKRDIHVVGRQENWELADYEWIQVVLVFLGTYYSVSTYLLKWKQLNGTGERERKHTEVPIMEKQKQKLPQLHLCAQGGPQVTFRKEVKGHNTALWGYKEDCRAAEGWCTNQGSPVPPREEGVHVAQWCHEQQVSSDLVTLLCSANTICYCNG